MQKTGKETSGKANQDFIHEHPLAATGIALAIGLLAPLGLDILAQTGATDTADGDKSTPGKTSGATASLDFMQENPLMVTAAALTVGLLIPLCLDMLMQAGMEPPEDAKSKRTQRLPATNDDFIHQHPLMTTAAALAIGMLAPIGLPPPP